MATLRVTPDTGATIDVLREDVAIKVRASIEPNSNGYKLIDAQKKEIQIVGTCRLRIQRPGGCWRTVIAMVTKRLSDALLLSWSTHKNFGDSPAQLALGVTRQVSRIGTKEAVQRSQPCQDRRPRVASSAFLYPDARNMRGLLGRPR